MIEVQELAQQLIDEMTQEMNNKTNETKLLQGAIQGVNLLYTKIIENEQNNKTENKKPTRKTAAKK